jgi:hypothetical protein
VKVKVKVKEGGEGRKVKEGMKEGRKEGRGRSLPYEQMTYE